ncbi:MAG: alkaline phosphatase family protein [Acidimicrobiales bacterium]
MRRSPLRWLALLLPLVAVACGAGPGASPPQGSTAPAGPAVALSTKPCGTTATPPVWRHVVWIIEENRAYNQVVGSPDAPFLARLGRECGLATGYAGVAHPSLPNYLALTSGSTHGVADDAGPSTHPIGGPSIFSLLGSRWRTLAEAMPHACQRVPAGEYAVKHNPAAYYTSIRAACARQDVPLRPTPNLSAAFTVIIPDLCNDMHDCSTATGDAWLAKEMPLIFSSPAYRAGDTAVFITWDENDAGGRKVPLYVIAPSVRPGARVHEALSHYSLLRTTEEMLGLHPLLGAAARAPSMGRAFGLER